MYPVINHFCAFGATYKSKVLSSYVGFTSIPQTLLIHPRNHSYPRRIENNKRILLWVNLREIPVFSLMQMNFNNDILGFRRFSWQWISVSITTTLHPLMFKDLKMVKKIKFSTLCVNNVQIRSYFWSLFSCIRIK